jgi:spermidine synthase
LPVERQSRIRLRAQCIVVAVALGAGVFAVDRVMLRGEAHYYGAPILVAKQSHYQRIVLTQSRTTTRLFLNGNLQFSSDDEHRYHEVLVHPAVAALGRAPRQVLVLGGGDGLAVRELLRYPELERIVLVDLDEAVTELFRTLPVGIALNQRSLLDPRVVIRNEDAFRYVQEAAEAFDLAVVDFPDPSNYGVGKLYTLTFYEHLRERLGMRGVAVIQATSPYYARHSFWTIVRTLEAADFRTAPLHVHVPSFGDWGFVIAGGPGLALPTTLLVDASRLKFLDDQQLPSLFDFPRDVGPVEAPVNRLSDQQLVATYVREWGEWGR